MEKSIRRRNFMRIGAASALGTGIARAARAAAKKPKKRTNLPNTDLLEVGIIFGGGNHAQNMWARLINTVPNTNNIPYTPRRTGMVFTKVWSAVPEWAENFAETFGIAKVEKSFDAMAGKVDGLFIDAFHGVPWYPDLAKPYIDAGTPLFVNRPFADSIARAKQITEWAKEKKTPVMTGSSFEFLQSAEEVRSRFPHNSITGYESNNATSDFYSHGVHGLLWTYACVGGGIEAVSHKTKSWIKGGGDTYVIYKDRGNGPFRGVIRDIMIDKYLCGIKINGSDRRFGFGPCNWDRYMWIHMLQSIEEMFATGKMPNTHEEIVEKTSMFIAAFRSIIRENGKLVTLSALDEDWAIGTPWGHTANLSLEEQNMFIKLFGEKKGELRPDKTYG